MTILTADILSAIMPHAGSFVDTYVDPLNNAFNQFNISASDTRQAMFLAQIAEESGELRHTLEDLNYSAESLLRVWPSHFNTDNVNSYARNPEKIANRAYANRNGNGDESSGDGWNYRGRGLIQITFKDNYSACGNAINLDLVNSPELLEQATNAALSAAWFWQTRGCNELADNGDFEEITHRINGGLTNQPQRVAYLNSANSVFGL